MGGNRWLKTILQTPFAKSCFAIKTKFRLCRIDEGVLRALGIDGDPKTAAREVGRGVFKSVKGGVEELIESEIMDFLLDGLNGGGGGFGRGRRGVGGGESEGPPKALSLAKRSARRYMGTQRIDDFEDRSSKGGTRKSKSGRGKGKDTYKVFKDRVEARKVKRKEERQMRKLQGKPASKKKCQCRRKNYRSGGVDLSFEEEEEEDGGQYVLQQHDAAGRLRPGYSFNEVYGRWDGRRRRRSLSELEARRERRRQSRRQSRLDKWRSSGRGGSSLGVRRCSCR